VSEQLSVVHEPTPITVSSLHATRETLRRCARQGGLDHEPTSRFVAAVSEVANNTIAHANATGQLRIVQDDGTALIAEVSDRGPGLTSTGEAIPDSSATSGRGMWLARAFADRLTVHASRAGTIVRIVMFLRRRSADREAATRPDPSG
jgi:anti-sigma regulatory factor (Ser/Thr protein kinase)